MRIRANGRVRALSGLWLAGLVVGVMFGVLMPSAAFATSPGEPGTTQPGTRVFLEDFENGTASTPVRLTSYTGVAAADAETYTADPAWLSTADNCNGWIVDSQSPSSGLDSCLIGTAAAQADDVALAMGLFEGDSPSTAATNHILVDYTGLATVPGYELETDPDQIPAATGHYYTAEAEHAAMAYSGGLGARCDIKDPEIDLYLVDASSGARTQVASQLDPCTAPGAQLEPANGLTVAVANVVGDAALWDGGSHMGVDEYDETGTNSGDDGGTDNLQVLDVTPQLDVDFAQPHYTTGQSATVMYEITNTSEEDAKKDWDFSDSLPSGLTVVAGSTPTTTCDDPAGDGTNPATVDASGSSISVNGSLDSGEADCTVTVEVTSATASAYTLGQSDVTTGGSNGAGGIYGSLNPPAAARVTFQAAVSPDDLTVTEMPASHTIVPGGPDDLYTLTASNAGPGAAAGTQVVQTLPVGVSVNTSSPSFDSANCKVSGTVATGETVTCSAPATLTSGASVSFQVPLAAAASYAGATVVTPATVSSTTTDSSTNTSTTATVASTPSADLGVTDSLSHPTIAAGGQEAYLLTITNNGPSDAQGSTVTDQLPAGVTITSSANSAGICSGSGSSALSCDLGTIAPGQSVQVRVVANVAPRASSTLTDAARVGATTPDPSQANDTAHASFSATPATADLGVADTASTTKTTVGKRVSYTIKVTNHGPDAASLAQLTDSLSSNLKLISVRSSQGRCAKRSPLRCSLGTIAPGHSVTIKLVGTAKRPGSIKNVAKVSSATPDPHRANNDADARTAARPRSR